MKSPSLRYPLRDQLRDPVEDEKIEHWWSNIEHRTRSSSPRVRRVGTVLAAAAALVLIVFAGFTYDHDGQPVALLTEDGTPFTQLITTDRSSIAQRFADGSSITAMPNTAVQALASTGQDFSVLLQRGYIEVSVVPGGPQRWVIEAKQARVEVVGTKFGVQRSERDGVVVTVHEGTVLVRSPFLFEGVERVTAGNTLRVAPPEPKVTPPTPPSGTTTANDVPVRPTPVGQTTALTRLEPPPETAASLLTLADQARLAGNVTEAETTLERLLTEFQGAPEASLAAYTLGVVRMKLGKTASARDTLRRALNLGPPSSLKQDCYLRLIESEVALGNRVRALEALGAYNDEFPEGRYRRTLARLLAPSTNEARP